MGVQFVEAEPIHFQINHLMKTTSLENFSIHPALFRIAAFIETAATPKFFESAPVVTQAAFAGLRSEAKKPKNGEKKNAPAANAPENGVSKRRATWTSSTNNGNGGTREDSSHSLIELKRTEFHLEAPFAESVQLAADFTDWEKFPLDLIKSEDGVWYTSVPLPPGHYSYRFIVDGVWCDDPRPILRVPNPFGTANAIMNVA